MANRLSKRRRMRAKAAQAKRNEIVAHNLSTPKPPRSPKGLAVSAIDRDRVFAKTHLGTFRSPHHEGGAVKVIASRGFNLNRSTPSDVGGFRYQGEGKPTQPAQRPSFDAKRPKRYSKDGYDDGKRR